MFIGMGNKLIWSFKLKRELPTTEVERKASQLFKWMFSLSFTCAIDISIGNREFYLNYFHWSSKILPDANKDSTKKAKKKWSQISWKSTSCTEMRCQLDNSIWMTVLQYRKEQPMLQVIIEKLFDSAINVYGCVFYQFELRLSFWLYQTYQMFFICICIYIFFY